MDYKAGMSVYALAYLLGVVFVQQLAVLPGAVTQVLLLCVATLCFLILAFACSPKQYNLSKQNTLTISFILLIIIGILYSAYYAKQQLSLRFDEDLIGQNIIVSGRVASIPVTDDKVQRFEFDVQHHRMLTAENNHVSAVFPKKIRLSWYYGQAVNAGETWQLEVRLKPPHGFMNPGGFDYEAWLFQHGIHATGYVRKSRLNNLEQQGASSINTIRQSISQQIDAIAGSHDADMPETSETGTFSLIKALAIGDKSAISNQQWGVLAATGTSHLMAISGLHIGLASLFAYVLIRRLLPVFVMKRIPAQHVALAGGMVTALLYALIAGLSVPTQRAVIMLSVLSVMMLVRRNHRPVDALGMALLLVLIMDPLAVLSAGFWFSFSAVAVIFISIDSGNKSGVQKGAAKPSTWFRIVVILKQWVRLQLLISLFLLPLSLFMFQQVSLIAPVANLLLIPYVSFFVVPFVLLAIVCSFLFPALSDFLFIAAASSLDMAWTLLTYLSAMPNSLWVRGDVDVIDLLSTTAALLLLYFSGQISVSLFSKFNQQVQRYACWLLRLALCCLLLPVVITGKPGFDTGEYQLTVLDVGQGSAAVIQTKNHVAVFDTGAKFSERLNAGSGTVIPYLRSQGIKSLDRLIISHGDADHIGGAQAILDEYPAALVVGQDIGILQAGNKQLCSAGHRWRWDGVDFVFLSPETAEITTDPKDKRNAHSCVMQVSSSAGSVLFTGDIENKTENKLLDKYGAQLDSDILIVPHHGSKTSSSVSFIKAVDPVLSVISVGYKNRYRLPNSRVIARYDSMNSEWLQTDKTGAVTVRLSTEADLIIEKYRESAARYWHHISAHTPSD